MSTKPEGSKTPGARAKLLAASSLLKAAETPVTADLPPGQSAKPATGPVDPRDLELDAELAGGQVSAPPRQVEQEAKEMVPSVNPFADNAPPPAQHGEQMVDTRGAGARLAAALTPAPQAPAPQAQPEGEPELPPEAELQQEGEPEGDQLQPPPHDPNTRANDDDIDIDALLLQIEQLKEENAVLRQAKPGEAVKVDADIHNLRRQLEEQQAENKALRDFVVAPDINTLPPAVKEGSQWSGKNVRMLLPWFKVTNPGTVISVAAFGMIYGREKIGMIPRFGDSMIYNVRNALADEFLETGAEWSFWLDDDVVAPFGAAHLLRQFCGLTEGEIPDHILAVNSIEKLISTGKKLVGGVYWGRRKNSPPMFDAGMTQKAAYNAAKTMTGSVIPTDWVATGALMVHRDVYLDIRNRFPDLGPRPATTRRVHGYAYTCAGINQPGWTEDGSRIPNNGIEIRPEMRDVPVPEIKNWQYFAPAPGKGEDVMFCERAKAAGHQPYADAGVVCLHIGTTPYGPHNVSWGKMEGQGGQPFSGITLGR